MNSYELVAGEFRHTLELVSVSVDALVEPLERAAVGATNALLALALTLAPP